MCSKPLEYSVGNDLLLLVREREDTSGREVEAGMRGQRSLPVLEKHYLQDPLREPLFGVSILPSVM